MSSDAVVATAGAAASRSRSWVHYATLAAIGVVVVLVSLPRLRDFALRENASDARSLAQRIARELERAPAATIGEVFARAPTLARHATDSELFEGGALLRRHGYLFELVDRDRGAAVLAWPWRHGRTGVASYAVVDGELLAHQNPRGAWSGLDRRPTLSAEPRSSGWLAPMPDE